MVVLAPLVLEWLATAAVAQTQDATPEVGVIVVHPTEAPLPLEFAGRVAGFHDVEVRARVNGLLLKRDYAEGTRVTRGQPLFEIDPAPYRVALSRAQAALLQAQATLRRREADFARADELFQSHVSAAQQHDEALAARDQARAGAQLAQADVDAANLNLSYTTVSAPVPGVTSLQSPPVGSLVQAQQTLLTTITQIDPAYVNFSVSDEEDQAIQTINNRRDKPITNADLTVELQFGSGRTYPRPGRIDATSHRVDAQTGTIRIRAVFANPDGALLPGQFVRVHVQGISISHAIVIPFRAVSQGPQGPTVYVVDANGDAEIRPVRLGTEIGGGWVAEDGLRDGDRVVVDGIMRVRPGALVKPSTIAQGK